MQAADWLMLGTTALLSLFLLQGRLRRWDLWRATVTPLASIIGSGFLVAAPILAHTVGNWAWLAMLVLCALGYWFGSAIRFNIRHLEPLLGDSPARHVLALERAASLALALAYFVSVAYYLNLFAAFGLRLGEVVDPLWIRLLATLVIGALGLIGLLGGLGGLERIELIVVALKLALIGGLLLVLALANVEAWQSDTFVWRAHAHVGSWEGLSILLGLVILVQGFETSRYLGARYDAATRVRSMRLAQGLSTLIYLAFLLLITLQFSNGLPERGSETAVIDLLQPLGRLLAPLLILAALASQLSAAVADMNGAGGLLAEASGRRFRVRLGNLLTALVAIAITWLANLYEIITWASRMFVLYYALQAAQAGLLAWRLQRRWQAASFGAALLLALAVILFATPVEA
ncbi:hypothetical protein [Pseudomonas sp. BMS12]|uniref:hypothetical protein n=1 Tax=Pseudomonas sp. BMS12 TaxID=1796033 RepID=UPI0009EE3325|nr:hypothetical protein [Pseudomonas sp. BMS12]